MLNTCQIDHNLNSEKPEGFTCLYFPKDKVVSTAFDKTKAEKLVLIRDATSVKEVRALSEISDFRPLLIFTHQIAHEQNFKTLCKIMKDLLDALP